MKVEASAEVKVLGAKLHALKALQAAEGEEDCTNDPVYVPPGAGAEVAWAVFVLRHC
jgi:hypothetical protein